jgi:hypothetical protein
MKDLINEYSNKYINDEVKTKEGYCKRCLNERWKDSSKKKTLYSYILNGKEIYVCYDHIGCLEIGKELFSNLKEMNDIEKRKFKNGINELIKEGEVLLREN